MQRRDAYPIDTVTGACFITGDYSTDEGIVDLDLYLDVLPAFGRMCVSAKAVRMMVQVLGWEWPSEDWELERGVMADELERLRTENFRMRKALTKIVDVSKLGAIESWMVSS
jgi:hypothetical protein